MNSLNIPNELVLALNIAGVVVSFIAIHYMWRINKARSLGYGVLFIAILGRLSFRAYIQYAYHVGIEPDIVLEVGRQWSRSSDAVLMLGFLIYFALVINQARLTRG